MTREADEQVARRLLDAYLGGDQSAGMALIDHLQEALGLELSGKPSRVWVLYRGHNYNEDVESVGTFSSEANADLFKAAYKASREWDDSIRDPVEESLDPAVPQLMAGLTAWHVCVELATGLICDPVRLGDMYSAFLGGCVHRDSMKAGFGMDIIRGPVGSTGLVATSHVFAATMDDAVRVVNERRLRYVAEHGTGEPPW